MTFGWRARIGFISPLRHRIHTSALEMQMVAPEGVLIHSAYLDGPKSLAMDHLREVLPQVGQAVEELTSETDMDIILMGGAPICLANGSDELITIMQQTVDRPATTVVAGLVNGLRRLDAHKVVAVTPYYPAELAEMLRSFLTDSGFDVVSLVRGEDIEFSEHKNISQYDIYRLAKNAFLRGPKADALVLVGGGAPIHGVLEVLETDIGKPVITNNFASLWNALNMVNVRQPIEGYGKLLSCF